MIRRFCSYIAAFCAILALVSAVPCEAKLPELSPNDVVHIMEEITESHIDYHHISPELMQRSLSNFFDLMDPAKTYLTEEEVSPWLNLPQERLEEIAVAYRSGDFTVFKEIAQLMQNAIERRRKFIPKLASNAPPANEVSSDEFEDLEWVKGEEELLERNARIYALQQKITAKLEEDTREKFFQRLEKRRLHQEERLLTQDAEEFNYFLYTQVLKASSNACDNYTTYLTPGEATQFMINVQLRLFGIGVLMRDDLNGFTIIQLIEKGPADLSEKIKPNDRIIAVDHEPVVGMEITEAVELIRGPEGTKVTLTMLRDRQSAEPETFDVTLERGEIVLEDTRMAYDLTPFGDGVIATIHFPSFYQDENTSSAQDLKEAIESIKKEHAIKGIVMDLRNNTGGVLPQAVKVAGLFISKGVIASVVDRSQKPQHLREIDNEIVWNGPLIVLVNKASASATEIVAQSLQDYGRALVVGDEHTFGKGSFQVFSLNPSTPNEVNPLGEYKVTLGRYYTVSGRSPQLTGVVSDIAVPGPLERLKIGEQFSKFPLENNSIKPMFNDLLEDIPLFQRQHILPYYQANLQKPSEHWKNLLPQLKENSKKRLEENKAYQDLMELLKEDGKEEAVQAYLRSDFQKLETLNIMRDMILLDNS